MSNDRFKEHPAVSLFWIAALSAVVLICVFGPKDAGHVGCEMRIGSATTQSS
jgi:hypothetical protein